VVHQPNTQASERIARLMPKIKARKWSALPDWPAYQHALRLVKSLDEHT
jgi:hypothetical protein